MRFSCTRSRLLSTALIVPTALFALTGCGDTSPQTAPSESQTSSSAAAEPSDTPEALGAESAMDEASSSGEPAQAEPQDAPGDTPTEAPAASALPEPASQPSSNTQSAHEPDQGANVAVSDQESAAMKASAEELQQADAERKASIESQGMNPEDPYVKYGDILCAGGILPTPEEIAQMGASDAYLQWYTDFAAAAPQEVRDMSEANRSAAETNNMVMAQPNREKCTTYGF